MRGSVPGLPTPYPLAGLLPAFLQEDGFAVRWTAGLDDVLAPVIAVLDCLDAYVDPGLAPRDFRSWLAGWVGALTDEQWDDRRHWRAIAAAVTHYRARGTVAGLRAQLEVASGGRVEFVESGGVSWSTTPRDDWAADVEPHLAIGITVRDPEAVQWAALESVVMAAKPAHLPHTIEVTRDDRLP
jgi:phage tail-like protein